MATNNFYPIPVYTQKKGFIRAQDGATLGATLGENVFYLDGTVIQPGDFATPADVAAAIAAHEAAANPHPIYVTQAELDPQLALKANLASPAFTGNPTAPTPATADNDTSIATTAFVKNQGYALDSAVVHIAGIENITGIKRFTGGEIAIDNFSGIPTDGVIRFGNDNNGYIWKQGNNFRFNAGSTGEAVLNASGVIWTNSNLSSPMTTNTPQTVTATKTFTAQQIIDGQALRVQGWSGTAGDGVVYFGDAAADNYIYKAGSQFLFRFGAHIATLSAGGGIWTTADLPQPMTLNTGQTVTGPKLFNQQVGYINGLNAGRLDIGANPTSTVGDLGSFLYNRGAGDIWFGTNNTLRGKMLSDGAFRWEGEVQTTNVNSYRMVFGNYGMFQRNDGSDWYVLLTNSGDQYGNFNTLRPIRINLATGNIFFGHNATVTGRMDVGGQTTGTSRMFVKDGADTANPGGKVMNMYYLSGIYDGGVLQTYDYAVAAYKPTRFEASSWNWLENGATTKMTLDSSVPARSLQINGGVRSYGASAQLETEDRTSGRGWTWYGTGDTFYLYNGSSNILSMTPAGQLSPQTMTANGAAGSHFSGNGSGFQMNGLMYENGTTYNLAANGAVWVRNPRVFVQSGDPGAQAADGDLWFW